MQYKIILIILFTLSNIIFSQSEYEFLYRDNLRNGDVRAMGIGNSYLITSTSGMITGINPAKLSHLNNSLEFSLSMKTNMERRSIIILDGWGEFLADTDYVFNDHNYFFGSFGFNYKYMSDNGSFGFGICRKPYKSYDYIYEEEVRAERDYPDGYVGMKDPIIGYQVFKTEGMKYVNSIGAGYSIIVEDLSSTRPLAVGFGINYIEAFYFKKSTYIDTLHNTFDSNFLDNFDDIIQLEESSKDSSALETVLSIEIPVGNNITCYLSFQSLFNSVEEIFNQDTSSTVTSLGLELQPNSRTLIALQYQYGNEENNKFNIGFEYFPAKRIPIRAGLEFYEDDIGNISILTLGTGMKFNKLNFDVALNYYTTTHYSPNPLSENFINFLDCDIDCDKVTNNNLFISTSLKWSF